MIRLHHQNPLVSNTKYAEILGLWIKMRRHYFKKRRPHDLISTWVPLPLDGRVRKSHRETNFKSWIETYCMVGGPYENTKHLTFRLNTNYKIGQVKLVNYFHFLLISWYHLHKKWKRLSRHWLEFQYLFSKYSQLSR